MTPFSLLALIVLSVVPLQPQAPPDLSGTWRLDIEKSDFAREPPPKSKVVTIDHRDPILTLRVDEEGPRGRVSGTVSYRTDGQEAVNDVGGNRMTTVARWEGGTLLMTTRGKFGDNDIVLVDRYSLSSDGATLTVARHFEGAQRGGVQDQVLIHRKQ